MFERCPKINSRKCAFATINNDELHCGIVTGPLESTKVKHLPVCTKDMTKPQCKKHATGFSPKFS